MNTDIGARSILLAKKLEIARKFPNTTQIQLRPSGFMSNTKINIKFGDNIDVNAFVDTQEIVLKPVKLNNLDIAKDYIRLLKSSLRLLERLNKVSL